MKKSLLLVCALLLASCAVGNKYDYRSSPVVLPMKAPDHRTLILSVQDFRPYILNGDKDPNFVGLQRGGYGNPFDVTTSTGKPMTEDMAAAISKGFTDAGYRVIDIQGKPDNVSLVNSAVENGASRIIVLKVYDWKSDIHFGIKLHCDLRLSTFDANGKLLAESTMTFTEEIGGMLLGASKNSEVLADEFAKRIGYLFNKEEVRNALR